MYIGERIKELRQIKGLKLQELAQQSGVQIATLSRMEHKKMTGTLESHLAIARALGVNITELYSGITTAEHGLVEVVKPKHEVDVFVHSEKSSYEILAGKVLNKKMMPILLKIEPGGRTNPDENTAGSEKFVFILEGRV